MKELIKVSVITKKIICTFINVQLNIWEKNYETNNSYEQDRFYNRKQDTIGKNRISKCYF